MNEKGTNKLLTVFIKDHYHKLTAYIRRHINERYYGVEASDILHDAALRLFNAVGPDKRVENLSGYIYRSLSNSIRDYMRRGKQEYHAEDYTDGAGHCYLLENLTGTGCEGPEKEQKIEAMRKALSMLGEEEQELIYMNVLEGISLRRLAEMRGVPQGTLMARKHRLLARLNKRIMDEINSDNH
jgi:RNA polymerase sigma-70 factor (ECF subfamily)